jgi:hypothetical protein
VIDKKRFTVGSPVIVRALADIDSINCDDQWSTYKRVIQRKELSPFRVGWITGGTYIIEGIWSSGQYGDPNHFTPEKTVYVWLVRFGFTNKEVKVLDDDLDESLKDDTKNIPLRYLIPQPYATSYIETLKNEMLEWPRDAKGRWLKKTK